jgi:hypothetical protein
MAGFLDALCAIEGMEMKANARSITGRNMTVKRKLRRGFIK